MRNSQTLAARLVTYKTAGYALLVVLAGILLLLGSNLDWFKERPAWEATLNQLGGLLVTTGGLGVLWDLRGKRDIIDEVLEKVRVAADVDAAGIDRATMNWMDVPWEDLFKGATQIEVFISYGSTWRKIHWSKIQDFAQDEKHSLRMYLPDPTDASTMAVLAQRYDYTEEKIRSNVLETAQALAKLGETSPADIRIYYRAGDPTYTSYRFDDRVLVTLYSHRRERSDVPVLLVRRGSFKDFFVQDLEFIRAQSTEVAPSDLEGTVVQ